MTTYPNQRIIHVNKEQMNVDFLQIQNEHWYAAAKELTPSCFKVYLFIAANADNYDLAYSPKAISASLGISYQVASECFNVLEKKGYLVHKQGNVYDFYTTPCKVQTPVKYRDDPRKEQGIPPVKYRDDPRKEQGEIYNTYKTYTINNAGETSSPHLRKRFSEEIPFSNNSTVKNAQPPQAAAAPKPRKRSGLEAQLLEYIDSLSYSDAVKQELKNWIYSVGLKGKCSVAQLRANFESIETACNGNDAMIKESINYSFRGNYFPFYPPRPQNTSRTTASNNYQPNVQYKKADLSNLCDEAY